MFAKFVFSEICPVGYIQPQTGGQLPPPPPKNTKKAYSEAKNAKKSQKDKKGLD